MFRTYRLILTALAKMIALALLVGATPSFGGPLEDFYNSVTIFECSDPENETESKRLVLGRIAGKLEVLLPRDKGNQIFLEVTETTKGYKFAAQDAVAFLSELEGVWTFYSSSAEQHLALECTQFKDTAQAIAEALFESSESVSKGIINDQKNVIFNLELQYKRREAIISALRDQLTETKEDLAALQDSQAAPEIDDAELIRPQARPTGLPLTLDEKNALRVSVSRCWNVGSLSTEALETTVVVEFSMKPDGKPETSTIRMLSSSGGNDGAAQEAFSAARRAIIRCGASGFDLPPEKYEQWRDLEMNFDPGRLDIK